LAVKKANLLGGWLDLLEIFGFTDICINVYILYCICDIVVPEKNAYLIASQYTPGMGWKTLWNLVRECCFEEMTGSFMGMMIWNI
jgi:hypothetical protein